MKVSDFFDKTMLDKYNTAGPRYTSYPTAVAFSDTFKEEDFSQAFEATRDTHNNSLSLYLHIPFCHSLCYYCGCNKIVTRNQDKIEKYLSYLKKEIQQRASMFSTSVVNQIHFGGGTPSFLSGAQLHDLLQYIEQHFSLATNCEKSIELDPRKLDENYIDELSNMGFTRLSIGVQDVNKSVQEKINRVQSTRLIKALIKRAKLRGFASVNIDLIYGLPGQSEKSLLETLAQVKIMDPDRISLFSYAHMPQLFPAQRKIKDHWLPSPDTKFHLFRLCIKTLNDIGYDYIGMDHFAKPEDELSIAAKNATLSRNFQGYTTDQANTLLGLGVSSISNLGNAYAQNYKKLSDYYHAIDNTGLALEKGLRLHDEDIIHRAIIHQLMCNFTVDKATFSQQYHIEFDEYFADSLNQLAPFENDNLLSNTPISITIHPRGRLLVRNICMSFDQYLQKPMHQLRYSRVI
ncbi:MAG: oxygen-independent coproporphyrinogen III oxidase [Glaciecola sp.]